MTGRIGMLRHLAVGAALVLLGGCLPVPGGLTGAGGLMGAGGGATLAPAEVTVTSLPDSSATAATQEPPAPTSAAPANAEPASTAAVASNAAPDTAPDTAQSEPPPPPPDPETLACTRRGGQMVSGPGGFGRLCQVLTNDGGRPCRGAGDCTGHCLARGNVCAPVTPLLGCHDILLTDGRRVTQCIE